MRCFFFLKRVGPGFLDAILPMNFSVARALLRLDDIITTSFYKSRSQDMKIQIVWKSFTKTMAGCGCQSVVAKDFVMNFRGFATNYQWESRFLVDLGALFGLDFYNDACFLGVSLRGHVEILETAMYQQVKHLRSDVNDMS